MTAFSRKTDALEGQMALVTGGGMRIGRAIALALAAAGAGVAVTFNKSQAEAEQVASEVRAMGGRALAVHCDVRSEASARAAVEAAVSELGRLDLLVNNAAIFESAELGELSVSQWDAMFETNTRGPFLMAREALPHLRRQQGRIVNLGSLGGLRPWAGHAHYCASKAALHMLTLAMAKSFAPEVQVNCVAPGWIEQGSEDEALAARFAGRTPMGQNGAASDVAEAVLFFSTATRFITGQILAVDGGLGL